MPEATHRDQTQSQDSPLRPFVLINSFTPKPGKIDELARLLEAARDRFADRVPGFHGGRVYRDVDGSSALLISVFETEGHYESWIATTTFADYQRQIADITDGMGQSRIEAGWSPRTAGRGTMQMGDAAA
ncbi:MAG: antibiotic biosynthesis monooxygenase [Afipia sp.]|nr:MAG: antibiotic biosynthesis monooxygenase [Afipia sp.]